MNLIFAKNCTRNYKSIGDVWINKDHIVYVLLTDDNVHIVLESGLYDLVTESSHEEILDQMQFGSIDP